MQPDLAWTRIKTCGPDLDLTGRLFCQDAHPCPWSPGHLFVGPPGHLPPGQVKKFCISLLEAGGSFSYTREVMADLDTAIRCQAGPWIDMLL